MRRSGSADLPLHNGHVPKWLADRMTRLGAVISQAIVHHYGRDELLRRLAHPFWFQSFGAVMGMDWHSSGITTSVLGALKRGLAPLDRELGLYVCGGRGKHSRRTPDELVAIGERVGFDGDSLATASRLVAKVDSAAVQDGFDLYLHGFVVAEDGGWVVVQQGMNGASRQARRYHWLSEGLKSFVEAPHAAIEGRAQGDIFNLTDRRAEASRRGQLELLAALGPDGIARELAAIGAEDVKVQVQGTLPFLVMPEHHDVRTGDVHLRRLHGNLAAAAERGAADFPDLLLTPGVGARTVRALALVAEVAGSAIRHASLSPTAARTGIRSQSLSKCTTKPSVSSNRPCNAPSSARTNNWRRCKGSMRNRASWNGRRKARRSRACLRRSARTLISMAAAAFSAGSLPSNPPPIVARHRRGRNDALREPAPVPPESDLGADAALVPSGRTPDN
jgi:uncharacterized protein